MPEPSLDELRDAVERWRERVLMLAAGASRADVSYALGWFEITVTALAEAEVEARRPKRVARQAKPSPPGELLVDNIIATEAATTGPAP